MQFNIGQNLPTIVTLLFFAIFCFILFAIFKKGSKKKMKEYAKIPLKDEARNSNNGRSSQNRRYNNRSGKRPSSDKSSFNNNRNRGRGFDNKEENGGKSNSGYKGARYLGNNSKNKDKPQDVKN
jgi:cbb3-type cytochrome oxidase subunit 3